MATCSQEAEAGDSEFGVNLDYRAYLSSPKNKNKKRVYTEEL